MKKCVKCGAKLNPNETICIKCGTKVSSAKSENDSLDIFTLSQKFDLQLKKKQKLVKARVLCIRGQLLDAKAIYDSMIDDDPMDINPYIGLIRVASENYCIFDGDEINKSILIAQKILGKNNLSELDIDLADYISRRDAFHAEQDRIASEALRKEQEIKNKISIARRNKVDAINRIRKIKSIAVEAKIKEANHKFQKSREMVPVVEGKTVIFGMWPQSKMTDDVTIIDGPDGNLLYTGSDGEKYKKEKMLNRGEFYYKIEPIEWWILRNKNGTALLISKAVLDRRIFHTANCSYEGSEIRKWLNDDFINFAFSTKQQEYMKDTKINYDFRFHNVKDKIFLLSRSEVLRYKLAKRKKSKRFQFISRELTTTDWTGNSDWLLRSVQINQFLSCYTVCRRDDKMIIQSTGCSYKSGIAPAMRINLTIANEKHST